MDVLTAKLHEVQPHNVEESTAKFCAKLSEHLDCESLCGEWLTLQVELVSKSDIVVWHKDKKNCPFTGHDVTGCICFHLLDSLGSLWSMKSSMNSREINGQHFKKYHTTLSGVTLRVSA